MAPQEGAVKMVERETISDSTDGASTMDHTVKPAVIKIAVDGSSFMKGPTKAQSREAFLVFMLAGTSILAFWNSLLNVSASINQLLFPDNLEFGDTITACYTTTTLLLCFACSFVTSVKSWMLYVGCIVLAICSIVVAVVVQFCEGTVASVVLIVVCLCAGISAGIGQAAIFGYASVVGDGYGGAASAGLGVAGIVSFVLWMLVSKAFFNIDLYGLKCSTWILMAVIALLQFVTLMMLQRLVMKRWVIDGVSARARLSETERNAAASAVEEGKGVVQEEGGEAGWRGKLKDYGRIMWEGKQQLINIFIAMFFTLFVFPAIGPLSWGKSLIHTDMLTGIFQLGDFIGRYIPNLHHRFRFPPSSLRYIALGRGVFIALFMLSYRLSTNVFFGNIGWLYVQMALFAVSNGWLCTLCFVYSPARFESEKDRTTASGLTVLMNLAGMVLGLWLSRVLKL